VISVPDDTRVRADPSQLEQVVLNLVVNARDAMPEGGRLTVKVEHVELDESAAIALVEGHAGPYARLSISDTGMGIDEVTRAKLFEPFFTTKEQGKGTGLGLSIVYGIVKQTGGYINVISEPGRGAAFVIYLPAAAVAALPAPAVA
jgi:signal transduction histidine kinase